MSYPGSKSNLKDDTGLVSTTEAQHLQLHNQPASEINAIEDDLVDAQTAPLQTPASSAINITKKIGQILQQIKNIIGETNWYDTVAATISDIWAKFDSSTGHAHTGTADDAPQIPTGGIEDGAVTVNKIGAAAVDGEKIATNAITLGYAEITSDFSTSTEDADVDVTELAKTVTVPSGGRRVKIMVFIGGFYKSGSAGQTLYLKIKEGSTLLAQSQWNIAGSNYGFAAFCFSCSVPTAGNHTYKVAVMQDDAGTIQCSAAATRPSFILVELI